MAVVELISIDTVQSHLMFHLLNLIQYFEKVHNSHQLSQKKGPMFPDQGTHSRTRSPASCTVAANMDVHCCVSQTGPRRLIINKTQENLKFFGPQLSSKQ